MSSLHSSEPWSIFVADVDGRRDVVIVSASRLEVCTVGSLTGDELDDRQTLADARLIEKAPVLRNMLAYAKDLYNSLLAKSAALNGQANSLCSCVSEIAEVLGYIDTE